MFLSSLAACQPQADLASAEAPPPAGSTPDTSGEAITSGEGLAGEYRIAGADNEGINLPYGITASISADRIEVQAECLRIAWKYRFQGSRLVTEQVPQVSCRRALLPQEQAVEAAFTAAARVVRTPANGIVFTGGGRSVTLFSQ